DRAAGDAVGQQPGRQHQLGLRLRLGSVRGAGRLDAPGPADAGPAPAGLPADAPAVYACAALEPRVAFHTGTVSSRRGARASGPASWYSFAAKESLGRRPGERRAAGPCSPFQT